jgi:hypothetical protein
MSREHPVYDGLRCLGRIVTGKRKAFRAVDADGRSLGEFDRENAAMRAITAVPKPSEPRQ